jgi:ubiquinol-cytochrome c reductase subunit 7
MQIVREALKRISDKEVFDRTFRIRRAMQLDLLKEELPKEEWIRRETDVPYLWKHVVDICHEREERNKYDKSIPKPPKSFLT